MSFSKLVKVIGPAPSEMNREDLMRKLSAERDRVRRTIMWFREFKWSPKPKKTTKKKGGKPATKITTKMKKAGVTIEQMKLALAQIAEEKGITNAK